MEEPEHLETTDSTQGGLKVSCKGFLYLKDKVGAEQRTYWECEWRKIKGCKGRIITIDMGNNLHKLISESKKEHNHTPIATRLGVSRATSSLKRKAVETTIGPALLIQESKNTASTEVSAALPSMSALSQVVKRAKKKNAQQREPTNLAATCIDIPEDLKRTINGQLFLYKEIEVGEHRMLMFMSNENFQKMAESRVWIMDGTFRTVPNMFHQLYTIMCEVGPDGSKEFLPKLFVLMTGKSKELYSRILEELIDKAEDDGIALSVGHIITDLEMAAITAVRDKLPTVRHKVCFYHLGQVIWRQIQKADLAALYGQNEEICLLMRKIGALAFLPPDEIKQAYEMMDKSFRNTENEKVIKVWAWFGEYYVKGRLRRRNAQGQDIYSEPMFAPNLWSIYDNLENSLPRTQNNLEGWHRRWKELLAGKCHIGLYNFIGALREEEHFSSMKQEDINRGEQTPVPRKVRMREEKIMRLHRNREGRPIEHLLTGFAHNTHFAINMHRRDDQENILPRDIVADD